MPGTPRVSLCVMTCINDFGPWSCCAISSERDGSERARVRAACLRGVGYITWLDGLMSGAGAACERKGCTLASQRVVPGGLNLLAGLVQREHTRALVHVIEHVAQVLNEGNGLLTVGAGLVGAVCDV